MPRTSRMTTSSAFLSSSSWAMRRARASACGFSAGPTFCWVAPGSFTFFFALRGTLPAVFLRAGAFLGAGPLPLGAVLPVAVFFCLRAAGALALVALFFRGVVFFFVAMCGAPYRTLGNTAWVLYGVLSMSDARLEQFKKMAADFPDSPMSHFSLGKLYLERKQYAEAASALEAAVKLDPTYAAALVSLGDALSGAGQVERAREVLTTAREHALAQGHPGLAEEIDERISDL